MGTTIRSLAPAILCSLAAGSGANGQQQATHDSLRIGLVSSSAPALARSEESVVHGVRLGAGEARQTATLFGDDVVLYEAATGKDATAAAAQLLSQRQIQVLIGSSPQNADALSRFAEDHHILFLNVASRSQSLRSACRRYTFHIEGTDAMYANAARALTRGSVAAALSAAPARPDSVVLWGSTLERYGASQINDRYRARFHAGMNGDAWAGWASVKIVAETSLRTRSTEPSRLLVYLESPSTQFDGHKGWPLSFRLADHQLRQPLYAALPTTGPPRSREQTLRDVPELRDISLTGSAAAPPQRASQVLDRLISSPTAPRCPWSRR